ncbi:MAG: dTDP-4-dehydrorhamnose 3,5-epimerase family protein, partial [Porticoccaceae bacterium]|nr:dTDP-4-dehydrorhamnose 3,5-epimerase family protein [Porticoccaceae bacterium]
MATAIADVLLIKPKVFGDSRGYFQETFQAQRYRDAGIT